MAYGISHSKAGFRIALALRLFHLRKFIAPPKGFIIDSMTFKYRRKITITEQSGSDLADYQVLIELNSTNFDFSHAQTNGEDIRFTDANGNLLPYWIEERDAVNKKAKVWVKVPSIPANSSVEIWMYYGNSELESASDGEATFLLFDDFSAYTLSVYGYYDSDEAISKAIASGHSAVYDSVSNKIFFVFVDKDGKHFVYYYDHETGEVSGLYYTGIGATADLCHGAPAIAIDNDGYLWVFSGSHGTKSRVAVSKNPRDPSEWEEKTSIGQNEGTGGQGGVTYPQPIPVSDGMLVIFRYDEWEGGAQYDAPLYMFKSTDRGETWTQTKLVEVYAAKHYPFLFRKINGKIYGLVSPRNVDGDNYWHGVMFMMSDDEGQTWKKADGTVYTLPVDDTQADWIVNDLHYRGWTVNVLPSGKPVALVFNESTHDLYLYKWNGSAWEQHAIDNLGDVGHAGKELGCIKIIDENTIEVYASKNIGGIVEIVKYKTSDGGSTWTMEQITSNSAYQNARPEPVEPANNGVVDVIWNYGGSAETVEIKTYPINIPSPIPHEGKWSNDFDPFEISNGVFSTTDGNNQVGMISEDVISVSDVAMRWRFKYSGTIDNPAIAMKLHHAGNLDESWDDHNGYQILLSYDPTTRDYNYYIRLRYEGAFEGEAKSKPEDLPRDEWNVFEFRKIGKKISLLKDGVEKLTSTTTNELTSGKVMLGTWTQDGDTHLWDFVLVRKYTEPEPSVSLGGEETA